MMDKSNQKDILGTKMNQKNLKNHKWTICLPSGDLQKGFETEITSVPTKEIITFVRKDKFEM